jgi:hypothetical protein
MLSAWSYICSSIAKAMMYDRQNASADTAAFPFFPLAIP